MNKIQQQRRRILPPPPMKRCWGLQGLMLVALLAAATMTTTTMAATDDFVHPLKRAKDLCKEDCEKNKRKWYVKYIIISFLVVLEGKRGAWYPRPIFIFVFLHLFDSPPTPTISLLYRCARTSFFPSTQSCFNRFNSRRQRDNFGNCNTNCDFNDAKCYSLCKKKESRCKRSLACAAGTGGTSSKQENGELCLVNTDCKSGICVGELCMSGKQAVGDDCDTNVEIDFATGIKTKVDDDADCSSGVCVKGICRESGRRANGESCSTADHCTSRICANGECREARREEDKKCDIDDACVSRVCVNGKCKDGKREVGQKCNGTSKFSQRNDAKSCFCRSVSNTSLLSLALTLWQFDFLVSLFLPRF